MANIKHNIKNLILKGKSFTSVFNSSKENILYGTLDKRGWQSVSGGGGDSPAAIFLSAAGITDPTITSAVNDLVAGLQADGLWSKMKAIYPMVGGNATAHSYNLKDISKYQITWSGGLTHSSTGVLPNGSNGYGNTNFNDSLLTANNSHLSYYSRTNASTVTYEIGLYSSTLAKGIWMALRDNANRFAGGIFQAGSAGELTVTNLDSKGFYTGGKNGSNVVTFYKNGSNVASGAKTDTTATNSNLFLATLNSDGSPAFGYSNKECAFATIGDGLSDTDASNLYTRIQTFQTTLNRFVGTPIYPSFDSDAQSFMTSASITDSTQQAAVNYLVTDLKANNLWTKMKALYPMVGGTATSHSYNLKNPAQYQITWNGGLTHSSTGVLPNGTTGYGNTNFNPSSNLTTNSAHHSFYFRTNRAITWSSGHGIQQSNVLCMTLYPYTFNIGWINDMFDNGATRLSINTGNSTGYVIGTRTSSNSHKLFRNNTQIANSTSTTTGTLPNTNYFIGSLNYLGSANYYDNNEMAMVTIGDGLTDAEASTLYTITQNYQTILSRNI